MKISGNEIKPGMLLEHKDDLWEVLKTQHVKPGKGGAFNQVEMKSINKSTKLNERFRSSDTVEKAAVEEIKFNYLYEDEKSYYFMNPKNFEQSEMNKDTVGEKGKFLKENLEILIPSMSFIISPFFKPAELAPDSLSIPLIKNPSVSSTSNSLALKLFKEVPVTPRNPY